MFLFSIVFKDAIIDDFVDEYPELQVADAELVLKRNFFKVTVSYEELNYESRTEVPAYEVCNV